MRVENEKLEIILEKLEDQHKKIDIHALINVLHIIKYLEMEEPAEQEDEYLDAFVALGGCYDKTGTIEIHRIREIIKDDFELTISMEEYLNSVDSENALDFYQFCVLLDASTSGNPSRFSSLLSNRGFSVL